MSVPGLVRLGDVALGAAVRAGESTAEAVERLRAAAPKQPLRSRADLVQERFDALRRRGEAERRRGQGALSRAVDAAMTAIATSPLVERIVEIQVDRVLAMLEKEPERIQVLVRGQRDTVVGEMVGRVRSGAVAGDAAVDRLTLRMTRRGGASEPT
ncbi:succinate dehydrogenase/fumarate reductase flavoprotein subunit [Actinoplanes lutulentus]|uniref:Uncharacterized protein n=1 Tax=Actinoplanes lutulentus TaxID=1287878 RepID=A0A327ZB14_9ACTN|nr:hypothetical protein [Actinoplanes lutulentus]MBB2941310.1 succinate dehydrogenase/fumarate reductase flavoprotein subunit [Actinoplanes lutulentus]RAK36802.1 hypothetical protein B0I29_10764 [Actinoplanes lutulentus]